jgi:hypothetical protein
MDEIYDFIAVNGVSFRALLTHDADNGKPLVKFYDRRFDFTPNGQYFGASYYVSTLVGTGYESCSRDGLDLQSGVPDWSIDARSFRTVAHWLMEMVA